MPVARAAEIRSGSRGNLLRQLLSANVDAGVVKALFWLLAWVAWLHISYVPTCTEQNCRTECYSRVYVCIAAMVTKTGALTLKLH